MNDATQINARYKWIITVSLIFWSLMTACTGFVGGMCGLIFFRSIAAERGGRSAAHDA